MIVRIHSYVCIDFSPLLPLNSNLWSKHLEHDDNILSELGDMKWMDMYTVQKKNLKY